MAKSFISFLIGAAIDDGLIKSISDPITNYVPELLERDPRFQKKYRLNIQYKSYPFQLY